VTVELPKPRDQTDTKGLVEFTRLRTQVQRLIRREAGSEAVTSNPQSYGS
jgi:hypothetical protein